MVRRHLRVNSSQLQARVKETHHHEVIDLGQRRIHLYAVPSSHATDMLVAYDEVSGILFQEIFSLYLNVAPLLPLLSM